MEPAVPTIPLLAGIVDAVLAVDATTAELMASIRRPALTNVMTSVTGLGSVAAAGVFLGLAYLAGWREEFRRATIALAITGVVVAVLMATVERPFPPNPVCVTDGAGTPTTSFPSGHAAAMVVYAMVARRSPTLPFGPVASLAAVTAVSRVYLGTHYLSDTVAGVVLGVAAVLLAEWLLGRIDERALADELGLPGA